MLLVYIIKELLQRENISIFMLAIGFRAFLHSNIRQMDKPIIWVVRIQEELVRASPEITFWAKVGVALRIKENPYSNVELPLVDEKWPLDVLLNDEAIVFVFWLVLVSLRGSDGWSRRTFGVRGLHLVIKFAFASYLRLPKLCFHACLPLRSLVLRLVLRKVQVVRLALLVVGIFVGLIADAQILQIVFVYRLNVLWELCGSGDQRFHRRVALHSSIWRYQCARALWAPWRAPMTFLRCGQYSLSALRL